VNVIFKIIIFQVDSDEKNDNGGGSTRKRKADNETGNSDNGTGNDSVAGGTGASSSGIGSSESGSNEKEGDENDPKRPRSSVGSNVTDLGLDLDDDSEEEEEESVGGDHNVQEDATNENNDFQEDATNETNDVEEADETADDDGSVVGSSNPGSVAGGDQAAGPSGPTEGKLEWLSYKELMGTTYPIKSQKLYLAAFNNFESYLKKSGSYDPKSPPAELSILNYFHHLRTVDGWASTTLWSHFSRVNAVMKRTWGINLTIYPRLSELLKGFESGEKVKKSSVFTPQQVRIAIVIPI